MSITGKTIFQLQHDETKRYLYAEERLEYNHQNCGNSCPIIGQAEISCDVKSSANTRWKITSVIKFD